MKSEKIYLERILKTIQGIEDYIGDDTFEDFSTNQMKIDACFMKLQVLWETMKKIWKYDGIPYKEIAWLRDWISHDYFWLDLYPFYFGFPKFFRRLKNSTSLNGVQTWDSNSFRLLQFSGKPILLGYINHLGDTQTRSAFS